MNKNIKKIVKKSAASFFWGMYMLPIKERRAICTLYAFCQHINDIVYSDSPLSQKKEIIDAWYQELNNIYDKKTPASNIGRNIYKNCMRFSLPKQKMVDLLDGLTMDIPNPIQAPLDEDFKKYCQNVACSAIDISLRIFGITDEKIIQSLSYSLGYALEITKILKDIREDAIANRLYIPKNILLKAGINDLSPQSVITNKNLVYAREELAKYALEQYKISFDLINKLDKKSSRNIKAIALIYKKYFNIMQLRGWEIISPKPKIGLAKKIYLILKAYSGS